MSPGEVAEFDTRLLHWFGAAGAEPVEILSLLGRQGERLHVRAAPRERRGLRVPLGVVSLSWLFT